MKQFFYDLYHPTRLLEVISNPIAIYIVFHILAIIVNEIGLSVTQETEIYGPTLLVWLFGLFFSLVSTVFIIFNYIKQHLNKGEDNGNVQTGV